MENSIKEIRERLEAITACNYASEDEIHAVIKDNFNRKLAEVLSHAEVDLAFLLQEVERLEGERDRAIEDANCFGGCFVCKNNDGKCWKNGECKGQEWRGIGGKPK